jgi:toxin CcdB
MARYDVYPGAPGRGLLLDCQSDVLGHLASRVVVPLMPAANVEPIPRLNPLFTVNGQTLVMATHLIFAIPLERLQRPVANLEAEHYMIMGALDMLITGF